jgi:hypothetical protein
VKHPVNERFRLFGQEFPEGTVPNGEARKHVDLRNKPAAAAMLQRIHHSGRWASLLATVAPDEDFAETYKMMALRGVTNLTFERRDVSDRGVSLSQHLEDNTTLKAKAVCIGRYLGVPW